MKKYKDIENNEIKPVFKNNKNALACSCSAEYSPYLATYLQSIREHASSKNKYDIIVFESSWSEELKQKFQTFFNSDNFSVRFVNPEYLFNGINLYVTHTYFKRECYFRLAAPIVLKNYDKILFTDIDLIAMNDIANIFKFNLRGNTIAACIEPIYKIFYYSGRSIAGINIKEYTDHVLQIKPENYYNTGVLLIDVKKYLNENAFEKMLKLISQHKFVYQEQCALNRFYRRKITTLPIEWNYELDPNVLDNPDLAKNINDVNICHYLGRYKPWDVPNVPYGEIWWKYAQKTPFYEQCLSKIASKQFEQLRNDFIKIHFPNINGHFANLDNMIRVSFVANHMLFFGFKKYLYHIYKHFSFTKVVRKKYAVKYSDLKKLLKMAKHFRKGIL